MQWSIFQPVSAGCTTFQILNEVLNQGQMTIPKIKDEQ